MIRVLLSMMLAYSGPYGWGFNPAPYPMIYWQGNLCNWVPGDFDWDGDVDYDDLEPFMGCASGPGVPYPYQYEDGSPANCYVADLDDDGDVDQSDFGVLQRLMR